MSMARSRPAGGSELTQVVILHPFNMLHPTEGRMVERGDVLELALPKAQELVDRKDARSFARVRSLKADLHVGSRTHAKGEEFYVDQERAELLKSHKLVEILRPALRSSGA